MELEGLSLTHRWTLKETDLYNYTVALTEIDRMRKDGRWGELEEKDKDGEKKHKAAGQYVSGNSMRRLPVSDIMGLISSPRCSSMYYEDATVSSTSFSRRVNLSPRS